MKARFQSRNLNGSDKSEDLCVDGIIILKTAVKETGYEVVD
jgi:hypothetical protein